jgi:hypothetical protein
VKYLVLAGAIGLAACATAGQEQPDAPKPGSDASGPQDAPIDMQVDLCPSTDTCPAATMLGNVSGDTGAQKLTAMGSKAAWFRVRVTEDDNSVGGTALSVSAVLTSPANVNFDVFVYLNAGSDVVECNTTVGTTTHNGTVDKNRVVWGEGTIANGSDDGRNVSIEVRPITGACNPGQTWQLEITGNT